MCSSTHLSREFLFLQWACILDTACLFQVDEQNKAQNSNLSFLKQKKHQNLKSPLLQSQSEPLNYFNTIFLLKSTNITLW